ncbi:MAG: hypothetical protein JWQ69_3767 [Pseudomonas sp.]|nr:hypothetical protein [Pseudomonas sp.]
MKFLNSTQPNARSGHGIKHSGDSQTHNPLSMDSPVQSKVGEGDMKKSRVRMGG